MKFKISRNRWQRGHIGLDVMLLNTETDKMCCLGFYSEACGVDPADLREKQAPHNVADAIGHIPAGLEWLVEPEGGGFYGSLVANELMRANDRPTLSDEEREKQVSDLFAQNGHEVEFIDG